MGKHRHEGGRCPFPCVQESIFHGSTSTRAPNHVRWPIWNAYNRCHHDHHRDRHHIVNEYIVVVQNGRGSLIELVSYNKLEKAIRRLVDL
jgi:hypothetical protein